jgi:ligand-binding SRPBCC domain-containing protein
MVWRPVYTLHRVQRLRRGLHETFELFERPENLPRITPPWLDLRILTPGPIAMARGLVIDYRVRVMGVRTHWRSLISEYDPPHAFRDVQVIGPYRLWDHRHRFRRDGGGTLIEDFVVYQPPLGPLGALLHRLSIRRQLEAIFEFRRRRVEQLLAPRGEGVLEPGRAAAGSGLAI